MMRMYGNDVTFWIGDLSRHFRSIRSIRRDINVVSKSFRNTISEIKFTVDAIRYRLPRGKLKNSLKQKLFAEFLIQMEQCVLVNDIWNYLSYLLCHFRWVWIVSKCSWFNQTMQFIESAVLFLNKMVWTKRFKFLSYSILRWSPPFHLRSNWLFSHFFVENVGILHGILNYKLRSCMMGFFLVMNDCCWRKTLLTTSICNNEFNKLLEHKLNILYVSSHGRRGLFYFLI